MKEFKSLCHEIVVLFLPAFLCLSCHPNTTTQCVLSTPIVIFAIDYEGVFTVLSTIANGVTPGMNPTFSGKPGKNSAPLTGKELATWLMTHFPENGKKTGKKETLTFNLGGHVLTTGMETGNKSYDASPKDITALRLALGFNGNKETFTQFIRNPVASEKFTNRFKARVAKEKAAIANATHPVDTAKGATASANNAQRRWTA
jgi:hypothetical protein